MSIPPVSQSPFTLPAATKTEQAQVARVPDNDGDADDRPGAVDTDHDSGGRVNIKA